MKKIICCVLMVVMVCFSCVGYCENYAEAIEGLLEIDDTYLNMGFDSSVIYEITRMSDEDSDGIADGVINFSDGSYIIYTYEDGNFELVVSTTNGLGYGYSQTDTFKLSMIMFANDTIEEFVDDYFETHTELGFTKYNDEDGYYYKLSE